MWRFLYLVVFGLLFGCQAQISPGGGTGSLAPSQSTALARTADDLLVVDCLIPGQMRKIGRQMTYLTPRRSLKTTAIDCEIRGGEYVAFDRANYKTALNVWQEQAEKGDRVAQTYVGEIYEKGLGTAPDYRLAAEWYKRAADQGYSRAQVNLANLLEQGLGVRQDKVAALDLYRQAAGLTGSLNLEGPSRDQSLQKEVEGLRRELDRRTQELEDLREHLKRDQDSLRKSQESVPRETYQQDIALLEQHVKQLQQMVAQKDKEIGSLAQTRKPADQGLTAPAIPPIDFGRYYALIIGNNEYENLADLKTAVNDARELERVLKARYGFITKVLPNAKRFEILTELNKFRENLTEKDNFLLYFAGHGKLDERNNRGHWLPTDAHPDNTANWISNITITDILNTMSARHVLVVADSCYSGIMTRSGVPALQAGMSQDLRITLLETLANKRSRTVLTSGGLEPVLDVGGGAHSLFAKVFLDTLLDNRGLLEAQNLHKVVFPAVSSAARVLGARQEPEYAPIHFAGHEGGEFFFVPVSGLTSLGHWTSMPGR